MCRSGQQPITPEMVPCKSVDRSILLDTRRIPTKHSSPVIIPILNSCPTKPCHPHYPNGLASPDQHRRRTLAPIPPLLSRSPTAYTAGLDANHAGRPRPDAGAHIPAIDASAERRTASPSKTRPRCLFHRGDAMHTHTRLSLGPLLTICPTDISRPLSGGQHRPGGSLVASLPRKRVIEGPGARHVPLGAQ